MNSFTLRLESILYFLYIYIKKKSILVLLRKIGSKMHEKKLIIHWELKKVLPYDFSFYFMIMITDITDIFQFPKFTSG